MSSLDRRVIYCPKREQHARPKILILLGKSNLTINCHEHGWIDIELFRGDEIIDFSDVSVRITDVPKSTHFNLEEIPSLANGVFETKKKRNYVHN